MKGPSSHGYGFSSGHLWMWELDYKESWVPKNWCFWTVVFVDDSWESLGLQGDPTSPSWRSVLGVHWKDWCWSCNSNTFTTWCEEPTHLKRPWHRERLKVGGEGDNRGWDGWMALPTQWTWVWVNSGVDDGQGGLACSSLWGRKESDTTKPLNWTESQGGNGDTDTEDGPVDTVGRESGTGGESGSSVYTLPRVKSVPAEKLLWSPAWPLWWPRGWGEERKAQEGGDIRIIMAGVCCCMAENTTLESNFPPIKGWIFKNQN